jgi:hypothetical protein
MEPNGLQAKFTDGDGASDCVSMFNPVAVVHGCCRLRV